MLLKLQDLGSERTKASVYGGGFRAADAGNTAAALPRPCKWNFRVGVLYVLRQRVSEQAHHVSSVISTNSRVPTFVLCILFPSWKLFFFSAFAFIVFLRPQTYHDVPLLTFSPRIRVVLISPGDSRLNKGYIKNRTTLFFASFPPAHP